MPVLYKIYKNMNTESKNYGMYYGRVVTTKTMTYQELCKHMSEHNSIYGEDVCLGVANKLQTCLLEQLLEGKKVQFGELGTFYLSVKSSGADTEDDYNVGVNIKGLHLRFAPNRTDLNNRCTSEKTVSVLMDAMINAAADPDLMGCRVVTFGIPGCDPYDPASVAAAPDVPHYLVLNVSYYNGTYRNVRIDITDKVRALPTGGVIDLELDVNDFPPPEDPQPGSGFQALVDDWEEEEAGYTIVQ